MRASYDRHFFITLSIVVPFFVYLLTLAPSVVFFDSGELITGSFLVASAHPPGYPLYVLMGKVGTLLPFGSVAYKVNMMSGFFAALSCAMVFLITSMLIKGLDPAVDRLKYNSTISCVTALTFAFSYNLWNQSVFAEVYPLNTFFTGLIIYLVLIWARDNDARHKSMLTVEGSDQASTSYLVPGSSEEEISLNRMRGGDSRFLYMVVFLIGLGLGNHHTLVVLIPIVIIAVIAVNWRLLFNLRKWGVTLLFFFLGISIYLLLPLRATTNPELNWGDPDTMNKFKWVFFREGYPREGLARSWSLFLKQLKTFDILYEFSGAGFIVGCIGLIAYFRKRLLELLITITVIIILSLGIIIYGNPSADNVFLIESFHTPSYMIFSIWIGAGIYYILSRISKITSNKIIMIWALLLSFFIPAFVLTYFYPWNNRSGDYIAYDYARNELATVPTNSILFTWGDSGAFPIWYIQSVERYQPTVLLIHTPHLATKWYVDLLPDSVRLGQLQYIPVDILYAEKAFMMMIRENYGKFPMYIDYSTRYSLETEGYYNIPQGLLYQITNSDMVMSDVTLWDTYFTRRLYERDPFRDLDTGKAVNIYAGTLFETGYHIMQLGYSDEAYAIFSEVLKINPAMKTQVREVMFENNSS